MTDHHTLADQLHDRAVWTALAASRQPFPEEAATLRAAANDLVIASHALRPAAATA